VSREPVRILHVIGGLETGGAETMLRKLVTELDPKEFVNAVVSMTDLGPVGKSIEEAGVSVTALGMRRAGFFIPPFRRFVRLAQAFRPHVVQAWMYHAGWFVTAAKAFGLPGRIAWNLRCSDMDDGRYSRRAAWAKKLGALLSGLPDAVIVNSKAGLAYHESIGYAPKRWEYVPNGFDPERFRPELKVREAFRRELGLGESAVLIGMAARADPMKDHATLFTAAEILARSVPDAHFVLCGDGTEKNGELAASLKGSLAGRFFFLGRRDDMPRVLAGLDLFTLSSAFGEGFANVIGEAMACGVPCVATDVGDARDIIGLAGLVVKPRDPKALAEAWGEILAADAARKERLGRLARERVGELFSIDAVAARYADIYRGLALGVTSRENARAAK
jgi:glycosyltransferase involved in cell wall biosynthesis